MSKIEQLIQFLKASVKPINPLALKQFLADLNLSSADLKPWADLDHPKHEGYGRQLVHEEADFEVMVMSWQPNDFSAVHNHGYTQWGAVQVLGHASHYIYKLQNQSLKLVEKQCLKANEIILVTNEFIHQMGNQSTQPYLSLHIYGSVEPLDTITADSLIYELENQRIVKTTGGAFFQLDESNVEEVATLNCQDESTQLEFAATILPKSQHFKPNQKAKIHQWIQSIGA